MPVLPSRIPYLARLSNSPDPAVRHRPLGCDALLAIATRAAPAELRKINMRATTDCDYYGLADMHKTVLS